MSTLLVYKSSPKVKLPALATEESACFDVESFFEVGQKIRVFNSVNRETKVLTKEIQGETAFLLHPAHRAFVPTGLIFNIPPDHVLKMYVRSSVAAKKGLVLTNGVGIIDSDYFHETHILLTNISDSIVRVVSGERLAQCKLEKNLSYSIQETSKKPAQRTSRAGGIGSTGD